MLHRINLPDCVPQLEQIRQFQRDVLAMACSEQVSLPLTEVMLKDVLGDVRGGWLWKRLWKQRGAAREKETEFHLALEAFVKYVKLYPDTRDVILETFDIDGAFHKSLDDPGFYFHFDEFSEELRNALKPLMISFYEDLLASGFETAIHGEVDKLDRDAFIASFWRANRSLEVCPVCDRQRSDKVDNKVYDDADHFLPKSKYPFLSLHYENLLPSCIYCNRSFKGPRDSIDNPRNAPLLNIFHPYERPALEHLNIIANRDNAGATTIAIEDRAGMPSRRVENLKRVFRLHERWPDQLRYQIECLCDQVANAGRRTRRDAHKQELTEQELRAELEDMLTERQEKLGKRVGYILQMSYLSFVLQDADEFEELFRQYAGL